MRTYIYYDLIGLNMREDIRYYIGTHTECQALVDFFDMMGIPHTVYGITDWTTGVKFMSPFIGKEQYDRIMEDY